jgi:mono/diheme cytochrome c family protein
MAAGVVLLMGLTAMAQMPQQGGGDPEEGGGGARTPIPTKITTVKATRTATKTVKVAVPVTQAARNDTPVFRGEGWFQQYCGVCHLGRWRKNGQLKPVQSLEGVFTKNPGPDREAYVRAYIQNGSANMPGFRNTFTPAQFDELIAFLKTY